MDKLNSQMLPAPADWSALFGSERGDRDSRDSRPLIVEIGFGQGTFLLHLARCYPDANLIGLEISNRSLIKTEAKIERAGLTNIRLVHSTAETALHHLFVPASIWQLHVNFPDPWFKKDHSHRRLMQRDTLDAIVSRLAPGGEFYLATDILAYAEMAHELLAATPGLDNQLASAWVDELPGRVVTKYEAAARREGRACCYFAYRRNHLPAPDVPVIEDKPMPHVVFASPLSLDDMAARFEPLRQGENGINVNISHAYVGREAVLFETHVAEPTISQHVALVIVAREHPDTPGASEFTLQLSTIGQPRPTAGVHLAVRSLTDWFLRLHPENRIVKAKVSSE